MSHHKFTVDRATWLRGEGSDDSYLHRPSDGKMCCLGFYLESCGFTRSELDRVQAPHEKELASGPKREQIPKDLLMEATWRSEDGGLCPSQVCADLMSYNDDQDMTDEEREGYIKFLFEKIDVEVEFVG